MLIVLIRFRQQLWNGVDLDSAQQEVAILELAATHNYYTNHRNYIMCVHVCFLFLIGTRFLGCIQEVAHRTAGMGCC